MSEFEAKRWEAKTNPDDHKPIDAVRAVLRDMESGVLNPRHIVIVHGGDAKDETSVRCGYFQAGQLGNYFGAIGLLSKVLSVMKET